MIENTIVKSKSLKCIAKKLSNKSGGGYGRNDGKDCSEGASALQVGSGETSSADELAYRGSNRLMAAAKASAPARMMSKAA